MHRLASIIASALVLSIIIVATAFVASVSSPDRGRPTVRVITGNTATTTKTTNSTELIVHLFFPNGTRLTSGDMFADTIPTQNTSEKFVFSPMNPGSYALNLTGVEGVFLPPTIAQVSPGLNALDVTVYPLKIIVLIATSSLSFNGTQTGPIITVHNNTAVRLVIHNNTTQIFNIAVVSSLYNTSTSNVLFDSLSSTVNGGGTLNDTFIVNKIGTFYYQSLIGNQAREGEYGYFTVGS
jgi:hypothetical protein